MENLHFMLGFKKSVENHFTCNTHSQEIMQLKYF